MLVLTRRIGEKIIINENIIVTLLQIRNKQVSIGLEAPKDISILREELLNKENNNKNSKYKNGGK